MPSNEKQFFNVARNENPFITTSGLREVHTKGNESELQIYVTADFAIHQRHY